MDISRDVQWGVSTPDAAARAFPYYILEQGYFEAGPQYFTRRSDADYYLLIYTVSGQGSMRTEDGETRLNPGTAVIVNCRRFHEYRTASRELWKFHWMHLSGAGMDGFRDMLTDRLTPVMLENEDEIVRRFEAMLFKMPMSDILACAEMSQRISELLLIMLRAKASAEDDSHSMWRHEIKLLAEYILENYAKPLSLDDFMAVTHLSRYRLIHLFREQTGMPPYQYMHYCRINNAQKLLRASGMSVSEVARKVGYENHMLFLHHFKKIVGKTPTQYAAESVKMPLY
jgi:AraC-like DNA-binding protein